VSFKINVVKQVRRDFQTTENAICWLLQEPCISSCLKKALVTEYHFPVDFIGRLVCSDKSSHAFIMF